MQADKGDERLDGGVLIEIRAQEGLGASGWGEAICKLRILSRSDFINTIKRAFQEARSAYKAEK